MTNRTTLVRARSRSLARGRSAFVLAVAVSAPAPPASRRSCETTTSVTFLALPCRSSYLRVCNRPSRNTSFPVVTYCPAISASLFQQTQRNHSTRSLFSPSRLLNDSLTASKKLANGLPPAVNFSSAFPPDRPINTTLFTPISGTCFTPFFPNCPSSCNRRRLIGASAEPGSVLCRAATNDTVRAAYYVNAPARMVTLHTWVGLGRTRDGVAPGSVESPPLPFG